jgi:Ni,Fe-hydrogenase I small subunit
MLKIAEVEIKKEHTMLMVNKTTDFKKSGRKTKGPKGTSHKGSKHHVVPPKVAAKTKTGVTCFYCKEEGHWKRNCPKYLEDKKADMIVANTKVFVIYM